MLPVRPGPRGGHKLTPAVVAFLDEQRARDPTLRTAQLVQLVQERFGLVVHRRSVERALARRRRKGGTGAAMTADARAGHPAPTAYEQLRAWAPARPGRAAPPGLALLLRRGLPAWLMACHHVAADRRPIARVPPWPRPAAATREPPPVMPRSPCLATMVAPVQQEVPA